MSIKEFTAERARRLNTLNIPDISSPFHARILWFETVKSNGADIYKEEHIHQFFEMHFVFWGEACYEVDGESMTLGTNEAVFLAPNTSHRFVKGESTFLKVSIAFLIEDAELSEKLLMPNIVKKFKFCEDIGQSVDFILKQSLADDFITPILISNRVLEIICGAFNAIGVELPKNENNELDSRLCVAKNYIEKNKNRLITCDEVAAECCLSRKQLSRIFKKYTGQTLNDFLLASRAQYAKRLVLQAEYSIKEISYMLGFENISGFGAFFKRNFGLSPVHFREENQLSAEELMARVRTHPNQ